MKPKRPYNRLTDPKVAFERGRRAAMQGASPSGCPYADALMADSWLRGLAEEKKKARKRR